MSDLRIFSYLPNPRLWKATIAARLCGVDIEVRGAAPNELANWLWDFDAHPLTEAEQANTEDVRVGTVGFTGRSLRKTEAFLDAHPFGTVPAAFSPDGKTGIFESNSILRTVARLGESRFRLYGRDAYESSRIDGFLDASLVFARDTQSYLLALLGGAVSAEIHSRALGGLKAYLAGIDRALQPDRKFLVGDGLTIADICYVAELALLHYERARVKELRASGLEPLLGEPTLGVFPHAMDHFRRLRTHPAFVSDVDPYLAKLERSGDPLVS
jgi:elongation factor 1-gamma